MLINTDWTMKTTAIGTSTYVAASSPDALAQFSIYIASVAFALAVLVIFFGIFGLCTLTFQSKCYRVTYAVFGFFVGLLMTIGSIGYTIPYAFNQGKLT